MPLLQLRPHPFTSLPAHPSLPADVVRPELRQFTCTALQEALELLHSVPSTFTADPKLRASPRHRRRSSFSGYGVNHLMPRTPKMKQNSGEFEAGLKSEHAEHEMEYTPSVSNVKRLLEWAAPQIGEVEVDGVRFRDVNIEVNLITHTFRPSALIAPRSFITLAISAAYDTPQKSFCTVQIPLRADSSSTPETILRQISSSVPKKAIFASYASVERVRLLSTTPSSQSLADPPRIEWTMATTSDAGGSIPQWVQRSWTLGGVPRAVVADVGLFIGWTMRRRNST
ncbi:hypothetical protein N7462_008681 [Penicillium macrosclerotiorum]|uniref:uncharacterized protein n=1 Tax=Penicillium macrosclerotiorum TaxID=303699 RepID=UPI002547D46C|nr:uncharacterized protein N7462_008681 [Penicillium macrosclerotiorum]KAJ5675784.1 hypothetical protein N7462_008681 [Penicillium macrosclerotiorum]